MPKVVDAQRDIPADRLANGSDDLGHARDALVRHAASESGTWRSPTADHAIVVLRRRADQAVRDLGQDAGNHVELDEGQTHSLAPPDALDVRLRRRVSRSRRVGVDAHAVPVLAAQELVAGHVVDLADEIPQRQLDSRDTATLAAPVAKALDGPKDHVHVAGVLPQEEALELESILLVASVAHLADAVHSLVGVDADERNPHRDPLEVHSAHVCDSEI